MITTQKSRKKLPVPKHYFLFCFTFHIIIVLKVKNNLFDNHNFYKRRNSDIEQENEKSPDINLTFLPFSTVSQHSNRN